VSLIQELIRNMEDERAVARRSRAQRRIEALRNGTARVCLVVLPEGVRVDPVHGQPIDFDAVMDELVSDAAERAGLVAVRAPPVGNDSPETHEALSNADVLVLDQTLANPIVTAAGASWQAYHKGRRPISIRAEGLPAAPGDETSSFTYTAAFGTGLSFTTPEAVEGALAAAPPGAATRRKQRAKWLERMAETEEWRLLLEELAGRVRDAPTISAVSAQVQGQRVVIYDDMIRSGSSLLNAAEAYRKSGAQEISVVVTHGVFPGDALARLQSSGLLSTVVCTDSHPRALELEGDFLRVRSVAPVLAGFLAAAP
jgi:hypothetical protein